MKKVIVLAAGCLLAVSAIAQSFNIEQKALDIAREIQQRSPYLTESQRYEIARDLESIRRTLRNEGGSNQGRPNRPDRYQSDLACISRDSDNRAPFIIVIRDGVDSRRTNAMFRTMDECTTALHSSIRLGRSSVFCSARDGDSRAPFVLNAVSRNGVERINGVTYGSMSTCNDLVKAGRVTRSGNALFCAPRDGDDRAPWVALELDTENMQVRAGNQTFSTKEECVNFVR
ncbi:hypothetical protein [Bdellovibrio sp. HCB2-146]|uniref:hypothetical protein n=1 Tax=Bdellovibrio sp. HCB2-146 TaxID=3394362 RepID=UPI0039BC75A8